MYILYIVDDAVELIGGLHTYCLLQLNCSHERYVGVACFFVDEAALSLFGILDGEEGRCVDATEGCMQKDCGRYTVGYATIAILCISSHVGVSLCPD